jgi:pilus assembly protein TadC
MTVAGAARAVASCGPPELGGLLCRAADLLALGADPATAWAEPEERLDRQGRAMLRLARRSASSGAALADGVAELAVESRQEAIHAAAAAAERAGVVIAGPLGACFLPAFACLGVVPVVAGLATEVFASGVL